MRKSLGAKAWLYPQPVLILATYDEEGGADIMNAAWGGMSDYNKISICLDKGHRTTANVLARKALTISMGTVEQMVACDYVGIVSAKDEKEKVRKSGFTLVPAGKVDAPVVQELPLTFECRLLSYDEKTETLVVEIVDISADESILTENGKIDLEKFHPLVFDASNATYVGLGAKVGNAFSDGKALK